MNPQAEHLKKQIFFFVGFAKKENIPSNICVFWILIENF